MSGQLARQGLRPVTPSFAYAIELPACVDLREKSWHNQAVPVD